MTKFIKPDEMDNITEKILLNANVNIVWSGDVEKVDIDSLIEFEYGLSFDWKNIDGLSEGGAVWAAINPKQKIIYINQTHEEQFNEKMGTLNFSKAHELGHWVLHVTEMNDYEQLTFCDTDRYYCKDMAKRNSEEVQADMFASSILMPKDILSNAIYGLRSQGKITFPQLYDLADNFEVSISALKVRLERFNLIYIDRDKKIYNSKEEAMGQTSFL